MCSHWTYILQKRMYFDVIGPRRQTVDNFVELEKVMQKFKTRRCAIEYDLAFSSIEGYR